VLENIRLLSNFENSEQKLLQIILVGQPELGARLNCPELRQIKQRVALRFHLNPLNYAECTQYIARRVGIVGGKVSLFDPKALETIYNYSSGIPRLINILCDNGLLAAYGSRQASVSADMIDDVARDLELIMRPPTVKHSTEALEQYRDNGFAASETRGENETLPLKTDTVVALSSDTFKMSVETSGKRQTVSHGGRVFEDRPGVVVPAEIFDTMTNVFTEAMGPMAKIVISDHVAAMGETIRAFPTIRLSELVDKISQEILSPRSRADFRQRIAQGIRELCDSIDNTAGV
jgi:hypothetical protein